MEPRIFRDSLVRVLGSTDQAEVVGLAPPPHGAGRFDLAIVDAGVVADADVVVELLGAGGAGGVAVLHGEGEDRVIELRDAPALFQVVAAHTGLDVTAVPDGHLEHHAGPAAGPRLDGDGPADAGGPLTHAP